VKQEELIFNGLFSIKLTILLVHLPRLQDYPMQLIVVEKKKKRFTKKEGPFDLNDEPPSPLLSDSSNDTSKHDDSSEEGEDHLEKKQLGVSGLKK
jgi:hypothetical protein